MRISMLSIRMLFFALALTTDSIADANLKSVWIELSGKMKVASEKALRCDTGISTDSLAGCDSFAQYMSANWQRMSELNAEFHNAGTAQINAVTSAEQFHRFTEETATVSRVTGAYRDAMKSHKTIAFSQKRAKSQPRFFPI